MEMEGERKGEARVFLPLALCLMWHLPLRWHLFNGFDSFWTGPPWFYLLPGDPVPWAPERLPCPWLSSRRCGSSFLLSLVSDCLNFPACLPSSSIICAINSLSLSLPGKMLRDFCFPNRTLIQPGKQTFTS